MKPSLLAVAIIASLLGLNAARAEVYPSRPITIVIPFAGGGGPMATLARLLGERVRASLGQPVIVENVAGAAGSIGVGRVARAVPDGYTLSVGPLNSHVLTGAIYKLPFDLLRDLEPVALLASNLRLSSRKILCRQRTSRN